MSFGRIVAAAASTAAVGACALVAVGMARAGAGATRAALDARPRPAAATSSIPALRSTPPALRAPLPAPVATSTLPAGGVTMRPPGGGAARQPAVTSSAPATPAAPITPTAALPSATAAVNPTAASTGLRGTVPARPTRPAAAPARTAVRTPARTSASARRSAPVTHPAPRYTASASPSPQPAAARGHALPVHYGTGSATRVITVAAYSRARTTAWLQRWRKAAGGGWWRVGPRIRAHVGAQGMTTSPSESTSATPMGSFTLTRAFGRYADPGTALPYTHTTPADWWISQSGPLYNTLQHCWSGCPFRRGSPNEHLYYETPYYDYAVVIDYNTRNAGPVRQGAGSAFFLHVSVGSATAGCVSVPAGDLVDILRWLTPDTHPRILIGVA